MNEVVLNELPEGWEWATMEDIADIVGGGTPKSKEKRFYEDGEIPWLTPADLSGYKNKHVSRGRRNITEAGLNSSSAKMMPAGAVLFTSRAPIGYVVIASNDICTNQGFKSFVLKNEDVLPDYVYWWLKGNKQLAESFANGTTFLELSGSRAKKLPIPLAPPEQQKRIVAKIEELFSHIDAGIEAIKKAKQLLKQYRQSVLKAAVTGELTKEWREANKDKLEPESDVHGSTSAAVAGREGAAQLLERILKERRQKWEEQQLEKFKVKGKMPKDDKWKEKYKDLSPVTEEEVELLPKLPDGWIYTRLGNVIDEPKYGTSKKCRYDVKGIGVLRIPNVAHGVIDSEDLKYAMFDDAEVETYRLNEGDILTIRSNGSINLVGKCALIDANDTKYLYAGYLIRLRPNSEVVDGSYLINALNSIQLRQQIESKAKSTSGVNNINSGEIQSLVIPMCSKEEQAISIKLVDEKLSSSDRLLEELNIQQIKAEKNKQSILASVFQGDIGGRI